MTTAVLYALAGVAVFAVGFHGLVVRPDFLRKIIGINIMGSGVFLVLIAMGSRHEGPADPVPQAMVLTGIVVAVSATAFALTLARRIRADSGAEGFLEDMGEGRGPQA
jgi:multicomponent Na+:H+ antiporter subunit C